MADHVEPYQATASVDASTCPRGQCQFNFPGTGPYKRLRVTSVSAQLPWGTDVIVLGLGAMGRCRISWRTQSC
jgi:hypothetical protein